VELTELEKIIEIDYKQSRLNAGIWIQSDGTEIPIRDMNMHHLNNCIAMIERKGTGGAWLLALNEEKRRRWDGTGEY
jgi:hypothetical protein